MKKYICTALALLIAASVFVGCGCTNRNVSNQPGGMITDPTTVPTTNPMPTKTTPPEDTTVPHRETTSPTHATTEPAMTDMTDATVDTQPGTGTTEGTMPSDAGRSRNRGMGGRS